MTASASPGASQTVSLQPEESAALPVVESPAGPIQSVSASAIAPLAHPKPLNPASFPDQPRPGSYQLPGTIGNVQHLLRSYGITASYDVIKKKQTLTVPGCQGSPDNADSVAFAQVLSLAALNGLPTSKLYPFVAAIADRNLTNPVASWITSRPWDGMDRLAVFYATLEQVSDFPAQLKEILLYRWLLSAVAAALMPYGFKARGVLTLQGPQSIGKTSWIAALVSDPILREALIKLDHHLDASNKDSILTAVTHWIVEIGELDSSFKKDVARLKGFLTNDRDKIRRPYGRVDSEYPRRTVFCATVNDSAFLVDATGNTRWWTIPIVSAKYQHGIDMQQLFAQIAVDYHKGEQWWLAMGEEALLESCNKQHRAVSATAERILSAIDVECRDATGLPSMTPTELLIQIGIRNPGNAQAKEAAAVLREHLGEHKRVQGRNVWRIPFRRNSDSPVREIDDFNAF
jgi:predicted P-loop ATPase